MGVSVRLSRNTRMYVPFWAAILFWLVAGPVVLAVYLAIGLAWLTVQVYRAIRN